MWGRGVSRGGITFVLLAAAALALPTLEGAEAAPRACVKSCWRPAQVVSWQLQLRGDLPSRPVARIYDVDGFAVGRRRVARLRNAGAKTICHFSAGIWERDRPDSDAFPRTLLGRRTGRPGERWLDIRRLRLRPLMLARLERCSSKGFDAVDPADLDGYRHRTGFALTRASQLRYNRWLANAAHGLGLSVGLRDDLRDAGQLVAYFDFALEETCFARGNCSGLNPFIEDGKAAFDVEYELERSSFCPSARAQGINAIRKRRTLGTFREPCAPVVSISSAPSDPSGPSATFGFLASPDAARLKCSLDGAAFALCGNPVSFGSLADGTHTVSVRAEDLGGAAGEPASYTWTVDAIPPAVSLVGPPDFAPDTRATFTFSADDPAAAFECRLDNAPYTSCASPARPAVTTAGPHVFRVRATDAVGNRSDPATHTWTVADAGRIRPWAPQFSSGGKLEATEAEALAEAQTFDLLIAHRNAFPAWLDEMSAANPDLLTLVYMNCTFTYRADFPESAYSHDADGNRIFPFEWPDTFLLDPTSPFARSFQVDRAEWLMRESGYDGLFLDVTGLGPLSPGYVSGLPIDPSTGVVWEPADWLAAVADLESEIKPVVAPAPIVTNGLKSGPAYFDPDAPRGDTIFGPDIMGSVAESFLRHSSSSLSTYPSETAWRQNVDMLVDVGAKGASVLAQTKTYADGTTAQKDAWLTFTVASYLLGNDGRAFLNFTYEKGDWTQDRAMYHLDLGPATGPYHAGGGVYQRDFVRGKALVNPGSASVTVAVGPGYTELDGTAVETVTLAAHSARILRRAE